MENKAHYALIGTFVLLAVMASVFFATWLSGRQFDQAYDEYTVAFTGPVRGLSKGSEVRLNGLIVGEVSKLSFDEGNPNLVFVTVQVIDGAPIFQDGFAQLEPLGLTGLNYVQIYPGTASLSMIDPEVERLPGKMSQFDTLIEGGGNIIDGTSLAIQKVNILMNEQTIEDLQAILRNLNTMSENFKDADVDTKLIEDAIKAWEQAGKDTSLAAKSVQATSDELNEFIENDMAATFAKATTTIETANQTLQDFSTLARDVSVTAQDIRDSINRLSSSGLADLEETTDALSELMITLSNIADQLERSPAQFLAGEEQEVMELPQ